MILNFLLAANTLDIQKRENKDL